MSYDENRAIEWMVEVQRLVSLTIRPDCKGSPEQRIQSALFLAQDAWAEGFVALGDLPGYVLSQDFVCGDPDTMAMLPPLPAYE